MKFYINNETKKIVFCACDCACVIDGFKELTANTTDGAKEKHVPVVENNGKAVKATVGSVLHPMSEEHSINFILLETTKGFQYKSLKSTDSPVAEFALTDDETPVAVYEYCNLHGLWKTTI